MSDRIDGNTTALRGSVDPGAQSQHTSGGFAPAGSWRGEAVRVEPPDIRSLLDNAKEELGFAHSERMESRSISERKIAHTHTDLSQRIQRMNQLQEYLGRLPDFDPRKYAAMLDDVRESGEGMEAIIRKVRERFGEPSHAFAALDLAQRQFREEGRDRRAEQVAAARDRFEAENGPAIRAGLNVSVAAFDVAEGDREAAQGLRDMYRDAAFSSPGPAGLYRGVTARFGTEDFARHIRFLTRAVGDDLGAVGPSADPVRLHELVRDLSTLRVLDTVHERCAQLAERVARQAGVPIAVTDVMQRLLPLTEEAIAGPSKLSVLPAQIGIPAERIEAQILFMREAREVMAMLPPALFRDTDARFALLRGVQEALDMLIEREESQ
jgi:type III secretion protein W